MLNRFNCLNDPVNAIDPDGLIAFGTTSGFSIGFILVVDFNIGLVGDTDGNLHLMVDLDLSLGPQIAFSGGGATVYYNPGTICDMEGEGLEVQARLGVTEFGKATSDPTKDTNDTYSLDIPFLGKGLELGIGIGPSFTNTWNINPFK